MIVDGLNDEQIDFLLNQVDAENWISREDIQFPSDLVDFVEEFDEVGAINHEEHRHWTEYISVKEIGGRYFGIVDITGMGDMDKSDTGFETPESICELKKITKTIETFEPI
jgi:hypothetical protein